MIITTQSLICKHLFYFPSLLSLDRIKVKTKFVTLVTSKWVHLVRFTIVPAKTVIVIKEKQVADQSSYVYFQVGTVDPVRDFRTMISQRDEDRFDEGMLCPWSCRIGKPFLK